MSQTFFISRAGADAELAAKIAGILEDAGDQVTLSQWDFTNRNFIERMHSTLSEAPRVIALLSPEYFKTDYCTSEWQGALAGDPLNSQARLVLMRIGECEPPGMLANMAYWDLVPIAGNESLLKDAVLNAVRTDRRGDAPWSSPYWRASRPLSDPEAIRPTPGFTGRDLELAQLDQAFAQTKVSAICGLGGSGKSALAREYGWRRREEYAVVWWLDAGSEDGIIEGLLRLGALFVRGLDQLSDRRAAARQVTTTILSGLSKPVLLIFDGLADERLLYAWQPRGDTHVLITSHVASWSHDVASIVIGSFRPADAVNYMLRESRRADLTERDAQAIVAALDALPLAVAHASAYLRATRTVTPQRYLERITEYLSRAPLNSEYPKSVFASFGAAIAQAEGQSHGAAALLSLASCFSRTAIADELFRQNVALPESPSAPPESEIALDDALGTLDRLWLLVYTASSRSYDMHRLVQLAALDRLGETAADWNRSAIKALNAAFPEVEFEAWPQCERYLSHARAVLDAVPAESDFIPASRLALKAATYLRDRGEFADAERLLEFALGIAERALGPEHLELASIANEVGHLCQLQGRFPDAESWHARALAVRESALEPNDALIADSLNDLAHALQNRERFEEAEKLHIRALRIYEDAYGLAHSRVATSLNNRGLMYAQQGRYKEAEELQLRALAILEQVHTGGHPDVARARNNIAQLYVNQRRFAEAEPLHQSAREMFEATLGAEHPDVATSLTNLAIIYMERGRFEEAERLHDRAYSILERLYGPEHPDVAWSLKLRAKLYERDGRESDARQLRERAAAIEASHASTE